MLRRIRAAGWSLIAVGVIAWTAVVVIGAFSAHSGTAFNKWVGWATIAAVLIAAAGVLPMLWDKIAGETGSEADLRAIEDKLRKVVLSQAQKARSRLIGPGVPGDEAANVPFDKSLRFHGVGGARDGYLASILEYYQSLTLRRLVVLGDPGAGKTVLALELQVRLLEARDREPDAPVPVLVSAAAFDTAQQWEKWLAGHLALRFGMKEETAALLLRDGRILPLVDGLDEMDPAGADEPKRAQALVNALNEAMRGRERAPVMATCRRREYDALSRGIERATHVEMTGLAGREAARYLRGQLHTTDETARWEPVLANLDEEPDGALAKQMATPWRLTLALAAFRDGDDPAALLPPAGITGDGYAQYLDRLLLDGYVPSAVRLHATGTPYSEPQVRRWLTALADGLAWQSRHGMSATDIVLHQWWRPTGQQITRRIHVALALLPAIAWIIAAAVIRNPLLGLEVFPLLPAVFFVASDSYLHPVRTRKITTRHALAVLRAGLIFGLAGGLADWLTSGIAARRMGEFAVVRMGGLVGGLLGLVVRLVLGLRASAVPDGRGPLAAVRADGISGLVVGLIGALTGGLMFGLAGGLRAGLTGGLAFGLALWLTLGGKVWVRYHVAIAVMAVRDRGPARFAAFLDWAAEAGLLRVSGIAYQFRHRQLQDWLTTRADATSTNPAQPD